MVDLHVSQPSKVSKIFLFDIVGRRHRLTEVRSTPTNLICLEEGDKKNAERQTHNELVRTTEIATAFGIAIQTREKIIQLYKMHSNFDVCIAGAGLSGAVLAERHASLGDRVVIFEKRDHIGGNVFGVRGHIVINDWNKIHGLTSYLFLFAIWMTRLHSSLKTLTRVCIE